MGNRYGLDMVRVTRTSESVCSRSQCVIEWWVQHVEFWRIAFGRIGSGGQALRQHCEMSGIGISWSWLGTTTCQPHSYLYSEWRERTSINFAIDIRFLDNVALNYRLRLISSLEQVRRDVDSLFRTRSDRIAETSRDDIMTSNVSFFSLIINSNYYEQCSKSKFSAEILEHVNTFYAFSILRFP